MLGADPELLKAQIIFPPQQPQAPQQPQPPQPPARPELPPNFPPLRPPALPPGIGGGFPNQFPNIGPGFFPQPGRGMPMIPGGMMPGMIPGMMPGMMPGMGGERAGQPQPAREENFDFNASFRKFQALMNEFRRTGDTLVGLQAMKVEEVLPQYKNNPLAALANQNLFIKMALLRRHGLLDLKMRNFEEIGDTLAKNYMIPQILVRANVDALDKFVEQIDLYLREKEIQTLNIMTLFPDRAAQFGNIQNLFISILNEDSYFRHVIMPSWQRFIEQTRRLKEHEELRNRMLMENKIPADKVTDWLAFRENAILIDPKYGPKKLKLPLLEEREEGVIEIKPGRPVRRKVE